MVDVLVLGATGYTGKLVTRYLAVHRERDSFTLGLAARSNSKLSQLVSDLSLSGVQTFTVDATDETSLATLLRESRTRVVLSTVGPYYTLGKPVARACAKQGVHYVDITGETPFVHDLILELDYLATKTHAVLVPSCGFDSLPSDALVYLSARTLRSSLESTSDSQSLGNVGVAESHTMYDMKGGISGGSLATALTIMESVSRKALARMRAPDVLSPIKTQTHEAPRLVYKLPVVRPARFGNAFPLAPHNVAIVQRTRGLLQLHAKKFDGDAENGADVQPAYAEDFTYSESVAASNQFTAFLVGLSLALGTACLFFLPPFRWLVKRIAPAPGQGPSDEALEKGFLKGRNISISTPLPGSNKPVIVESTIRGRGDPGYALTAVMASESALALLAPREKLSPLARTGGVLTPMSALGAGLLKRLSASGRFEFESNVREEGDK